MSEEFIDIANRVVRRRFVTLEVKKRRRRWALRLAFTAIILWFVWTTPHGETSKRKRV